MAEELGKVEKPPVEQFKKGRKLYFVPLINCSKEAPVDYIERFNRYWVQVEEHISSLEIKLGNVCKVYHELVAVAGGDGSKVIKDINDKSYEISRNRLDKGAQLQLIEDGELLTEVMDWALCLSVGLQNPKVFSRVYEFYGEANKKRNENITKQIEETLKADEIGLLFMREEHQVQFPPDVQVFYVAPPALDEIKRWLRDRSNKPPEEA